MLRACDHWIATIEKDAGTLASSVGTFDLFLDSGVTPGRTPTRRSEGLFDPHPDPSTLIVKASTPMLNTNAARQWTVTTRRSLLSVIVTSDV